MTPTTSTATSRIQVNPRPKKDADSSVLSHTIAGGTTGIVGEAVHEGSFGSASTASGNPRREGILGSVEGILDDGRALTVPSKRNGRVVVEAIALASKGLEVMEEIVVVAHVVDLGQGDTLVVASAA